LEERGWHPKEKGLLPPRVLLQWLVCCAKRQGNKDIKETPTTKQKREALLRHDRLVIGEALALLSRPSFSSQAWYVLEGLSRPDVYLQTEEAIVVIEGKRTETGPTTSTSWMPVRHQMLRHLDCAWEIRGPRRVFGFFVVEGMGGSEAVEVPDRWVEAVNQTTSPQALEGSLPHRTSEERAEIANCFLGVTTWQRVCSKFRIDWATLPE
jgi:hypothetical protein